MNNLSKLLLAVSVVLSAGSAYGLTYSCSTAIKMTRDGSTVYEETIAQPVGVTLANEIGGSSSNQYTSYFLKYADFGSPEILNLSGITSAAVSPSQEGSVETFLTQTLSLKSNVDSPYELRFFSYRGGYGVVDSLADLTLSDQDTGQVLRSIVGDTNGPVVVNLKAGRSYLLVARARTTVTGSASAYTQYASYLGTHKQPVPEPATMSLLLGVGALALRKRRISLP